MKFVKSFARFAFPVFLLVQGSQLLSTASSLKDGSQKLLRNEIVQVVVSTGPNGEPIESRGIPCVANRSKEGVAISYGFAMVEVQKQNGKILVFIGVKCSNEKPAGGYIELTKLDPLVQVDVMELGFGVVRTNVEVKPITELRRQGVLRQKKK